MTLDVLGALMPSVGLERAPAPPPIQVMVDLETLGTEPGCAVVAIGAVQFALEGPGPVVRARFERRVSIISNVRAGLTIHGPTLEWWMNQDPAAIAATFHGDRCSVFDACEGFARWVRELGPPDVPLLLWAKPPQFDQKILEAAFAATRTPVPWGHRDWRDLRTLEDVATQVGYAMPDTLATVKHSALADAEAQAQNAAKRLLYLRARGPRP